MSHPQTWTKVNCLVDEGVKPLVDALQAIPGLLTVDSCQGALDEWKKGHVHFTAEPIDLLFHICNSLSKTLLDKLNMRSGEWSISLVWLTGEVPMGTIEVVPDLIEKVAEAIR